MKQTHSANKIWKCNRACQRFFKVGSWQRYFEVTASSPTDDNTAKDDLRKSFFRQQQEEIRKVEQDAANAANLVEGFDGHRSAVIPWLKTTGIVDHVRGLKKDEIRTAIALPSGEEDSVLQNILEEMTTILEEAHKWCFDGPECMLTWPCRVVLSRFQSSQVELIGSTRAFAPSKKGSTLKTYFKAAKQFLAYLDRVAINRGYHFSTDPNDGTHRPEDVIELTAEQLQTWQSIRRLARQRHTSGDGERDDGLEDKLLDMWMLLVGHNTGARRYRSPLLSFCAMLSIKPSTSSWMEPGNFNSHLSAIIWVVQLLIFYDSARKERQGEGETLALVKQRCEKCLQQTVDTPMGEILRWRLLLFRISKDSVGTHQATWDEAEEVLKYEDTELHMNDIPRLLLSEYQECQQLLYEDLMFGINGIRHMHSWALKDNMDVDTVGWNFSQHRDNAAYLQGCDRVLLSAIEQSKSLCELFLTRSGDGDSLVWRENALASYEATVQEFLKRCAVLVHIDGGPPLREGELFSVIWKNTQKRRSIFIHLKRLMVHTTYDKSQEQRGIERDNIRFLSEPLADLLLDYLVYVMSLRQVFLRHSSPTSPVSPYLWAKDGKVWPDNKLTSCMEDASDRAGTPRLHISNWRQMTVAIVKTKFAAHIECFEIDPEDEDGEETEKDIRILTRMRNHKVRTANRAYANQTGATFGNVWDGLIRMGLRASTLWQDFWGVNVMLRNKKRPRSGSDTPRLAKRVAMGIYRPRKPWSPEALLGGLRMLYRNEDMGWKSVEQEQALTLIMSWTEQVVAILPTGAGKSLLFMLPCTLPDAGVTILVVPLVSLRGDLLRRLRELNIDHLEWLPGERREAGLVLVTVEAASTKDFLQYAQTLIAQQKLDRIVVDECHLTITAVDYRPAMVDLAIIRSLRTQFVYLTATLPPSMQTEFEERNYLLHPRVVRASSNRPNIFYKVHRAKRGKGSLLEQAAKRVRDAWERSELVNTSRDKIIVYVRTRQEAQQLALLLDCDSYTAESGSAEEKRQLLAQWTKSPSRPYMVATTALAEGFDYPHVRIVMNVNEPESLVIFAQESGRAGRDGQRAYSWVLLPLDWKPQDEVTVACEGLVSSTRDIGLRKRRDKRSMHRYLRGEQCYRTSLSQYLDVEQHHRWCMQEDVPCDVCKIGHQEAMEPPKMTKTGIEHTGIDLIRQGRLKAYSELARYREDLSAVHGTCLLCRALDQKWDHAFSSCVGRYEVFQERSKARRRHQAKGEEWLRPFTACFWCLNPQAICQRAEGEDGRQKEGCEYKDVVLPLCFGVFQSPPGPSWLLEEFGRDFSNIEGFFDWLGEVSEFGGGSAIQAVRVAALALKRLRVK
jgi:superfamily II DNA helicase RecQ